MTENKPIMIDGVDVSGCEHLYREIDCLAHMDYSECCEGYNPSYGYCPNTYCYFKQLTRKTQECEELREYHNKCCEEFENEKKELLEKYNQLSRDFYSGKYCNAEKCQQLDQLKASKEQAEQKLEKIHKLLTTCKANCDVPCELCEYSEQCEKEDTDTQILKIIEEVE